MRYEGHLWVCAVSYWCLSNYSVSSPTYFICFFLSHLQNNSLCVGVFRVLFCYSACMAALCWYCSNILLGFVLNPRTLPHLQAWNQIWPKSSKFNTIYFRGVVAVHIFVAKKYLVLVFRFGTHLPNECSVVHCMIKPCASHFNVWASLFTIQYVMCSMYVCWSLLRCK